MTVCIYFLFYSEASLSMVCVMTLVSSACWKPQPACILNYSNHEAIGWLCGNLVAGLCKYMAHEASVSYSLNVQYWLTSPSWCLLLKQWKLQAFISFSCHVILILTCRLPSPLGNSIWTSVNIFVTYSVEMGYIVCYSDILVTSHFSDRADSLQWAGLSVCYYDWACLLWNLARLLPRLTHCQAVLEGLLTVLLDSLWISEACLANHKSHFLWWPTNTDIH